jgi:hypothetical protein
MPYDTIVEKDCEVDFLYIDEGLRDEMRRFIKERIIQNLEATKRLLELGEDYIDTCVGIYTYAIEEYGKILFLKDLRPTPEKNDKLRVRYINRNNGFRAHEHKFNLALDSKDLPDSCKVLLEGGFIPSGFEASGFITPTRPNMKTRMSVFYADFDENNNYNSILKSPEVKRELFVTAVDDFLQHIREENYP